MNTPNFPAPVYVQAQPVLRSHGLAVAAMVLGIVSMFTGWLYLVPCILAIVFGHVALSQINRHGKRSGKGMAIAGFVLGYVSIVIYGLIFLAAFGASQG